MCRYVGSWRHRWCAAFWRHNVNPEGRDVLRQVCCAFSYDCLLRVYLDDTWSNSMSRDNDLRLKLATREKLRKFNSLRGEFCLCCILTSREVQLQFVFLLLRLPVFFIYFFIFFNRIHYLIVVCFFSLWRPGGAARWVLGRGGGDRCGWEPERGVRAADQRESWQEGASSWNSVQGVLRPTRM